MVALLTVAMSAGLAGADETVEEAVEGRVAGAPDEVCAVLRDLEGFRRWFPGIVAWRILAPGAEDPTAQEVRVYGRQHGPGPLADRDYVVRYRMRTPEPGRCELTAVAIPAAEPAPSEGVVRVEVMQTRWTVRPDGSASHVRYAIRALPGPIPEWARPERWRSASRTLLEALEAEIATRRPAA